MTADIKTVILSAGKDIVDGTVFPHIEKQRHTLAGNIGQKSCFLILAGLGELDEGLLTVHGAAVGQRHGGRLCKVRSFSGFTWFYPACTERKYENQT